MKWFTEAKPAGRKGVAGVAPRSKRARADDQLFDLANYQ